MAAITKLSSTDSAAAALFDQIKGENFIHCTSKRLYGTKAIGEGISIQTISNNYGIIMQLIGMLSPNLISNYYTVKSKIIKKAMNPDLYETLILRHQDEVNKQGHIVLMNIGADLFETQVNFAKHTPNSVPISIRKSLYGQGKALAIEQTSDTEDLGNYMLLVSNKDYSHTFKKLGELLAYLDKKKHTLPTMTSSLEKFNLYPEMNGGPPVTELLGAQVAALELELASQSVPPLTTTTYSSAVNTSIWDDLPQSTTITTRPIAVIPTATTYKLAVHNQPVHAS